MRLLIALQGVRRQAGGGSFKNERPIEQKTECRCATPAVLQKPFFDVSVCDALAATRHTATASTERGVPVEKI